MDSQNSPTKQTRFATIEINNSRCKFISYAENSTAGERCNAMKQRRLPKVALGQAETSCLRLAKRE